ncbi:MAG: ABC transporter substrate-binding protein [Lentisphaerota bacterium]
MNKSFHIALILSVFMFSSSYLSAGEFLPGIGKIVRKGEIKVAVCGMDEYPFFYEKEGADLDGLDIKIAKDIAAELGVKAVFDRSAGTFNAVIDMVAEGKADIAVSNLTVTLERAKKVRFSNPYFIHKCALLVNILTDSKLRLGLNFEKIKKSGTRIRIGIINGTFFTKYAKELIPGAEIVTYPDSDSAVQDVLAGNIYGWMAEEFTIRQSLWKNPKQIISLTCVVIDESRGETAIAVAPDNPDLADWINHYLQVKMVLWENENQDDFKDYLNILNWSPAGNTSSLPSVYTQKNSKSADREHPKKDFSMAKDKTPGNPFYIILPICAGTVVVILALFSLCPKRQKNVMASKELNSNE